MKFLTLRKIYVWIFLLGLFFIPFNSFRGIPWLGEYQKESAALFFILGCGLLGLEIIIKKRFSFPWRNGIFFTVLLFLGWCFIATVLNFKSVWNNDFKNIMGPERFIRQYVSIGLICFFFLIYFINALKGLKNGTLLVKIRRVFLCSLIIVSMYGILETLIIVYGKYSLMPILSLFNYFPFVEVKLVGERISSVCYEVPFLAIYLITISGWMLSYIVTARGILRFVPSLAVLGLTFYSGSRTGLVVITVQYLVFLGGLIFWKKYRKNVFYLFAGLVVIAISAVALSGGEVVNKLNDKLNSLNFQQNLRSSISNQSRFGMQYASYQVFKKNPVIGVGFGQLAYAAYGYYPAWSITNNYEFKLNYKNQRVNSFPPSYNIYLRILAECGIIGALLFLAVITMAIYRCITMFKTTDGPVKILGLVMLTSVVGLSLNWLQIDTFRIFGFWLCIAILSRGDIKEEDIDKMIGS